MTSAVLNCRLRDEGNVTCVAVEGTISRKQGPDDW